VRQCARTNNPLSLRHIVATLRAFLQWRHARGLLAEPLYQQIDTPRVYRGERLPRAIPWEQVQALLASIVREGRGGRRDFWRRSCGRLICTLDEMSRSGVLPQGRSLRPVIHWS
jgi:integrase